MRGYDQLSAVRGTAMPAFMVAGGGHPTAARLADRACSPLAAALVLVTTMSAVETKHATTAAATLPLFLKERPLASEVKDWVTAAKPLLPADQRALVDGITPRVLIQYTHASVPAALTLGTDVTAAMVATRDALRMQIEDANNLKTLSKQAHESEIKASLFTSLQSALKPNAPLLLNKLETECKQTGAYSDLYDGLAAWKELEKRGKIDAQRPGEAANHDARLTMLDLKPLAADATPDQFSAQGINKLPSLHADRANSRRYCRVPDGYRERVVPS